MNRSWGSTWGGWLGLATATLLAACEPAATRQAPAAAPNNAPAPAATPRPPHARVADSLRPVPPGAARVFTVRLPAAPRLAVPQVQLPEPGATRRLNAALTRLLLTANLTDTTRAASAALAIRRAAAEYQATNQIGLFGTSFEVLYNRAGLLSVALTTEFVGAYPWSATRYATFDTRTGRPLALASLLADTLALRQRWHRRINARLAAYHQVVAHDYPPAADAWATVRDYTGWSDTLRQLRPAARPALHEFALTARGLVLYTSFFFPHAVQALAPDAAYLFSYASLQPWLAPRSPLRGL